MSPKSVYIHIPFCDKICYYCDFVTFAGNRDEDKYIEYLLKERDLYNIQECNTLYLGGGTPSVLSPEKVNKIVSSFSFDENYEATIEVNPENKYMQNYSQYKWINRFSMGCQTFNDDLLNKIGRLHNSQDAFRAYEEATKHFKNINLDLMFALPGQTLQDLKKDLDIMKELDPQHISIYSLIWKDGTRFSRMKELGQISPISEDLEADMYEYIIEFLTSAGYVHYEISAFSKPGFESKHNLVYWDNDQYIGLGLAACGFVGDERYKNVKHFSKYYEQLDRNQKPKDEIEVLGEKKKLEIDLMLALRLLEKGASLERFESDIFQPYKKVLDQFVKDGFIEFSDGKYLLNKKGLFVANEIFERLIL